ncbi:kunitz-type trypsin inhibitor-like 1 protein [Vicia villosa]|uniref:kunitz-type trypsin inhibitor-like 1 protein n=1 Tax=Vicia villosa TaxID=3911 RepID=UPI00273A8BC5|nr:kunitz-type trypsin inhibitor-like 1 protein [Vicia villosa]
MNPLSSLALSFLLFTFITNLPSNTAAPSQVIDINGNPLIHGNQYFIFPATRKPGTGGLTLNKISDSECPLTVLQNNANKLGIPVKFTIPESTTGNILTGTDLDIEFTEKPSCAESSKWSVFVDNATQLNYVGIGGPENYHGVETIGGKFLIAKFGTAAIYRLGFCLDNDGDCGYLGLKAFGSEGGSRLIMTVTDPYFVVFVDAASVKSVAGGEISNI